uniref:CxC5 like cysteine cluster associated with KDZ domain-containing protein n=1 Tax=Amphimedon queenslandica TaxID=400682 RepID=A0A1X7UKL4_AMPQE
MSSTSTGKRSLQPKAGRASKKFRFNPEEAKENARQFDQLKLKLATAYNDFIASCQELLTRSSQYGDILKAIDLDLAGNKDKNCSVSTLFLVAALGLDGIDALRMAEHLVPKSFCNLRSNYITRIVNHVAKAEVVNNQNLQQFQNIASHINFFKREVATTGFEEDLQQLSQIAGKAYMAFVAPPVSTCLNYHCKLHKTEGSLSVHNSDINVTVHSLNGPVVASKVSLRCKECFTNYNHTWYGNHSSGERLYPEKVPLIEISNVSYAERVCNELTRVHVSDMFFNGELEEEHRSNTSFEWTKLRKQDREDRLKEVVENMVGISYPHVPTKECTEKACGSCWTIDGNWKLNFPHCMFPVHVSTPDFPALNIPDVCTSQPINSYTAFCENHCKIATDRGYPTGVTDFLKFVNKKANEDHIVDCVTTDTSATSSVSGKNTHLLTVLDDTTLANSTSCNKDLGRSNRLRHWSRGHLFICRPCGHIDYWQPLYKSESPSQVFVAVVQWLYDTLQTVPESEWKDIVLAYDAMCKLDGLLVASKPLPLPKPFDEMWTSIQKVIDTFHFKNHTDPVCITKYNPSKILEQHPQLNFMCCEQTFVWLSRYKKIVCSMSKNHHLFFLHRLVTRRNLYTKLCHENGRKPLLPKAKEAQVKESKEADTK